jgi:hypothetical protein
VADNVVPLKLDTRRAEALIRALAMNSINVEVTDHAEQRMEERGLTDHDLFDILTVGSVLDPPARTPRGEWKCKIVKRLRGGRDAGAITVIAKGTRLIVLTVEWEDLR